MAPRGCILGNYAAIHIDIHGPQRPLSRDFISVTTISFTLELNVLTTLGWITSYTDKRGPQRMCPGALSCSSTTSFSLEVLS